MVLLRLIKFILVFALVAALAVTAGIGFAIAGLVFLVLSRLFGRRGPQTTFRVYTTRNFRRPFNGPPFEMDRRPMRDVTPKEPERLSSPEA